MPHIHSLSVYRTTHTRTYMHTPCLICMPYMPYMYALYACLIYILSLSVAQHTHEYMHTPRALNQLPDLSTRTRARAHTHTHTHTHMHTVCRERRQPLHLAVSCQLHVQLPNPRWLLAGLFCKFSVCACMLVCVCVCVCVYWHHAMDTLHMIHSRVCVCVCVCARACTRVCVWCGWVYTGIIL